MNKTLLIQLGELLDKEISGQQLLQEILDVMREELAADRGTIFILNADKTELVSMAGHLPELPEIRVPITQGITGHVARTGEIVNIPYCQTDSRFWRKIDQKTGYKTRSLLAAPLKDTNGELIGIIQFLNKTNEEGIFTDRDADLLVELAAQTAAILEETTLGYKPRFKTLTNLPSVSSQTNASYLPLGDRFNRIVGFSEGMRTLFKNIRKVAPTEATVLLRGESGTGKTLIAKALHYNSRRRNGPFVSLDCSTLPEGLMENELFGHERGAYTGAHARKKGKVEVASKGTLFLDEIGELPLHLQSKLLTLLQEKTYSPVGSAEELHADIRIIAATNRNLEQLVRERKFRHDLYYRLRVVQLELPPLRQRGREDLLHLIDYLLMKNAKKHHRHTPKIREDALQALLNYSWPGNVREMENCLESALIFCEKEISLQDLPLPPSFLHSIAQNIDSTDNILHNPPQDNDESLELPSALSEVSTPSPHFNHDSTFDEQKKLSKPFLPSSYPLFQSEPTLKELEAQYLHYLLEKYDQNKTICAKICGVSRSTIIRKIKQYNLDEK